MENEIYVAPHVEIVEVEIEKGFAASNEDIKNEFVEF